MIMIGFGLLTALYLSLWLFLSRVSLLLGEKKKKGIVLSFFDTKVGVVFLFS